MNKKISRFLRNIFSWILLFFGTLFTAVGIFMSVATLFGMLELDSFVEGIWMFFTSIFVLFIGLKMFRRGYRIRVSLKQEKADASIPEAENTSASEQKEEQKSPTISQEMTSATAIEEEEPNRSERSDPSDPIVIPPLSEALQTGDVGAGSVDRHRTGGGEVYTQSNRTPRVKYYYFADGTLYFAGTGDTCSVENGGHDGRNTYMPETPPWDELVQKGTVRAIFDDGITGVGQGLLESLQNLEALYLADSVVCVHYNNLRKVHILRAGKRFSGFSGFTGPLTELVLPPGKVHFDYHNSGSYAGVTGATPEIQAVLDEKLAMEFGEECDKLFRLYPGVGKHLAAAAQFNKVFAAGTISSLNWNSTYKKSRLVPKDALWELHGLKPGGKKEDKISFELKWQYGHHDFMKVAALIHAALIKKPKEIHCTVDWLRCWNSEMNQWWISQFPDIALVITNEKGDVFRAEKPKPPVHSTRPVYELTALDLKAAERSLPDETRKEISSRFYQYTQDVQRGGARPEVAAANRGFVVLDHLRGRVEALEVVQLAQSSPPATSRTPFERAIRPYEIPAPKTVSKMSQEKDRFIILAETNLADNLTWGQTQYFAMDSRHFIPYYIIEQYDGQAVSQSWYDAKEEVTWEEVERYADPKRKYELGHREDQPWSKELAFYTEKSDGAMTIRWRAPRYGYYEATITRKNDKLTISKKQVYANGKIHPKVQSIDVVEKQMYYEQLRHALKQEGIHLPVYVVSSFVNAYHQKI